MHCTLSFIQMDITIPVCWDLKNCHDMWLRSCFEREAFCNTVQIWCGKRKEFRKWTNNNYRYVYHPWQRTNALLYGLDTGTTSHAPDTKGDFTDIALMCHDSKIRNKIGGGEHWSDKHSRSTRRAEYKQNYLFKGHFHVIWSLTVKTYYTISFWKSNNLTDKSIWIICSYDSMVIIKKNNSNMIFSHF